jgi:hypothetical protein
MRIVGSGIGHQFAEYASERVRVEEGDLEAEQSGPRLVVDELGAGRRESVELGPDVAHLEGDVVHARPALRDEPPYRRVLAERPQELDAAVSDEERGCLDPLAGDKLPMLDRRREETLVALDRAVEVVDGDPEVVDAPRWHAPMLAAARIGT